MAKLAIHTANGNTISAPFEAWVVAIINALDVRTQQEVFKRIASLGGASIIPDRYQIGEDELGTTTIVERPLLDLKSLRG